MGWDSQAHRGSSLRFLSTCCVLSCCSVLSTSPSPQEQTHGVWDWVTDLEQPRLMVQQRHPKKCWECSQCRCGPSGRPGQSCSGFLLCWPCNCLWAVGQMGGSSEPTFHPSSGRICSKAPRGSGEGCSHPLPGLLVLTSDNSLSPPIPHHLPEVTGRSPHRDLGTLGITLRAQTCIPNLHPADLCYIHSSPHRAWAAPAIGGCCPQTLPGSLWSRTPFLLQ